MKWNDNPITFSGNRSLGDCILSCLCRFSHHWGRQSINSKTHIFSRIHSVCETRADIWIKILSSQALNCLSSAFICIFWAWVIRMWPCLPQTTNCPELLMWEPCTNTGTSYPNSHWPLSAFTTDSTRENGSGWLESRVRFFVIRITFNNLGSFLLHKNTKTLSIQFDNFNEALQFTFNVY